MKLHNYIALATGLAGILAFGACDDDDSFDNPSGETVIYNISVANGGLSGADVIPGSVNEETKTIEFTIPAETDIQAVRFQGKLSLGAKFDQDTYDFYTSEQSTLESDITIVNVDNSQAYHVVLYLDEPVAAPVLNSIAVRDADGNICRGFVSDANNTLYLNCDGSPTAEIVEIGGRTTVLDVDFAGKPVFGADFNLAEVYGFCTTTGNVWSDFNAENTRWAQFDGTNMLIPSHEGGTCPKTLSYQSIAAGSPSENMLDVTGIEGGTFAVSAGGFSHGHIYICNLTTALPSPTFKIYHWADAAAPCETILDTAGNDDFKGRWGDNFSISLNEAGDGYIWLFDHAGGAFCLRFEVKGFTQVSEPVKIDCPYTMAYYASMNPVDGEENRYTLTSATQQTILLVDADLNVYNRIEPQEGAEFPVNAENDARIIKYNGERYLITCNAWGWMYRKAQTIRVYDISQGGDAQMGITNFNATDRTPIYTFELGGANCAAYTANTGAAIDSEGNLVIMGAAPRGGFAVIKVPRKRSSAE